MSLREVWLAPGVAVNRRLGARWLQFVVSPLTETKPSFVEYWIFSSIQTAVRYP
jgi:hypothetical protein